MATGLVEEKTKHAGWVDIRVAGTCQLQARQPDMFYFFLVRAQKTVQEAAESQHDDDIS